MYFRECFDTVLFGFAVFRPTPGIVAAFPGTSWIVTK